MELRRELIIKRRKIKELKKEIEELRTKIGEKQKELKGKVEKKQKDLSRERPWGSRRGVRRVRFLRYSRSCCIRNTLASENEEEIWPATRI